MATQVRKLERPVEERIARLESHVEHIQTDMTEMKTDIREMKTDIRRLDHSLSEFRLLMERSFTKLTLWGLTLYIALAASLLGVMAKGFGWIH